MELRRHCFRRNRRRLFTMPYRQERITMNMKHRAEIKEHRTNSREQRAKSEEQRERSKALYFLCFILFATCYLLFASIGEAKMKGRCKDCHSMHASTRFPVITQGGCHGTRTIEDPYLSLYRAHRPHICENDGSTAGKSYRFLYGINGVEQPNW